MNEFALFIKTNRVTQRNHVVVIWGLCGRHSKSTILSMVFTGAKRPAHKPGLEQFAYEVLILFT